MPTVETILNRMAQARADNRAALRSYSVTRHYSLFGKDPGNPKAEVVAHLTFEPPGTKLYLIEHAQGTGLGERIVRQMLKHEAIVAKDYSTTDISAANYDFRFLGEDYIDGYRCYVLELHPKREDKSLLHGKTWVDATTYLLRRMEGQPSKGVSWWIRQSSITLYYSDVGGMWLQTASESTANVRFLGQHTMISRDVGYKLGESAGSGY